MGMQNKKLRHITDNIHDTVYLSEFESIMMSTPFFYRLHDVYQSSTVYMTLPSNRTKRYEHSIGTMHLASKIFSSAISNSSQKDSEFFLRELNKIANKIIDNLKNRETLRIPYSCETINRIVEKVYPESENKILCNPNLESIRDIALNQFINPISISNAKDIKYIFLHQCVLQAIRIVALFHDIGHPPYSHIIEDVFSVLYDKSKMMNNKRAQGLVRILSPYFEKQEKYDFLLKTIDEDFLQNKKIAFHEKVGLRMLVSTLKCSLTEIFNKLGCTGKTLSREQKESIIIYYILVSEFVFGILYESEPLFRTLHRIIDGPIDADRLDYIVRDTRNSGIGWGYIPYERIIRSMKLIFAEDKQNFLIAFPEKLTDNLDDVIVARYKIYSRINAHHRAVKTSKLLQIAVRKLAEDYLEKETEEPLSKDIAHLWLALKDSLTDDVTNRKISKWNDSWLISVLNSSLVKLYEEDYQEDNNIRNILEEILLNQKKYYSLIKRQHDARNLAQQILIEAGLIEQKLSEIIMGEYSKLGEYIENPGIKEEFVSRGSIDSLNRLQLLKKCIKKADFEMLAIIMPFEEESVYNIIKNILNDIKESGEINGYIIEKNKTRENLGISDSEKDAIYLYSSDNLGPKLYDKDCVLASRLKALRESNLWLHAYVEPRNCEGNDVESLLEKIRTKIVKSIGKSIKKQFQILFPNVAL